MQQDRHASDLDRDLVARIHSRAAPWHGFVIARASVRSLCCANECSFDLVTTFAAVSPNRNPTRRKRLQWQNSHARSRRNSESFRAGTKVEPARRTSTIFPSSSLLPTGGSSSNMQSPRVTRNALSRVRSRAYDPVNEKTAVAHVKHDLTRLDLLRADGLDGENIARPQSREHADSGGAHFQCAPRSQRLGRQTASALVTCLRIH